MREAFGRRRLISDATRRALEDGLVTFVAVATLLILALSFSDLLPIGNESARRTYFAYCCMAGAAAAVMTGLLSRRRRTTRRAPTCNVCDYNLTGNVSGICPECGTAIRRHAKTRVRATGSGGSASARVTRAIDRQ